MSLIAELNRRNVFRVALLYIVAGWLLLQVAYALVGLLGVPGWAFRFIFALLLICFPLVLIFSWVFEITPEGIKREQHIDAHSSITHLTARKINLATAVLAVLAALIFAASSLIPETARLQTPPTDAQTVNETIDASPSPPANIEPAAESPSAEILMQKLTIDLQGHRGARGLLPENTIPAFLHALDLGVTTLEMDIAINAEGKAVVSHEPWMSAKICSHPDGRPVSVEEERNLRIFTMSDEEVAAFDCGSRGHPDFPGQQAMAVSKPLLGDLLQAVARHTAVTKREPVLFNIEIKSGPEGDNIFHPAVEEFARILYQTTKDNGTLDRTTVQSFDPRALEATHAIDAQVSTALLVENEDGIEANLARLSFLPDIYSPDHELVDRSMILTAHNQAIRVIPWTVNDKASMQRLVNMGVDGLITDYPDLAVNVLMDMQKQQ